MNVEIVARVFALPKAVLVGTLRLTEQWERFQLMVLNRWFNDHRMG